MHEIEIENTTVDQTITLLTENEFIKANRTKNGFVVIATTQEWFASYDATMAAFQGQVYFGEESGANFGIYNRSSTVVPLTNEVAGNADEGLWAKSDGTLTWKPIIGTRILEGTCKVILLRLYG